MPLKILRMEILKCAENSSENSYKISSSSFLIPLEILSVISLEITPGICLVIPFGVLLNIWRIWKSSCSCIFFFKEIFRKLLQELLQKYLQNIFASFTSIDKFQDIIWYFFCSLLKKIFRVFTIPLEIPSEIGTEKFSKIYNTVAFLPGFFWCPY